MEHPGEGPLHNPSRDLEDYGADYRPNCGQSYPLNSLESNVLNYPVGSPVGSVGYCSHHCLPHYDPNASPDSRSDSPADNSPHSPPHDCLQHSVYYPANDAGDNVVRDLLNDVADYVGGAGSFAQLTA